MSEDYKPSRWKSRREARKRWSLNAVRKRERNRIDRATAPLEDEPLFSVLHPKPARFDLRVNLERRDGMRIQFTLHNFYGKLIGRHVQMTPKQFGRNLGDIFQLWTTP
jgi:hypothetical protein